MNFVIIERRNRKMHRKSREVVQINEYSKLSDKALFKKLELEMQNFGTNDSIEHSIKPIIDELDKRNIEVPNFNTDTNWAELQTKHPLLFEDISQNISYKKKARHKLRLRPAIVVATITILLTSLFAAQAAGIDILGPLACWTQDIFYFERTGTSQESPPQNAIGSLKRLLRENNVEASVMPNWLPDGMKEIELSHTQNKYGVEYYAIYANEQNTVSLYISDWESGNNSFAYEKNPGDVQVYQANETNYYIMGNMNTTTIVWTAENYECSISTDLAIEDIERIIDSIT